MVVALIGVAIIKPWAPNTETAIDPSHVPSSSPPPAASPGPLRTATPDLLAMMQIDWAAIGAALRPHDDWGIRILVLGTMTTDPPMPSAGGLTEFWAPLNSSPENSDADAFVSFSEGIGRIAAIGVTTPLDEGPLDVRVWDNRAEGWLPVGVNGFTPREDPTARLLTVPDGWSSDGAWPPGTYRIDVLGEYGVKHFDLHLDGNRETATAVGAVRTTLSDGQLIALSSVVGGLIASGSPAMVQLTVGLPPSDDRHDEAEAWLALDPGRVLWMPAFPQPKPALRQPALEQAAAQQTALRHGALLRKALQLSAAQLPAVLGTAGVLGAVLGADESFVTARLTRIAPVREDFGDATLVESPVGSGRSGVAVFTSPDGLSAFPDSAYRIDALVYTGLGVVSRSWDLPVYPRGVDTESPLLTAVRGWANVATDRWKVLAPGRKAAVSPLHADVLPPDPDANCTGAADVGTAPPYIGVTVPLVRLDGVKVWRLDGRARGSVVRVEFTQVKQDFVALRPLGADWSKGNYGIALRLGLHAETVTICVR
jgi:hypothetical protein